MSHRADVAMLVPQNVRHQIEELPTESMQTTTTPPMVLSAEIAQSARQSVLCWLATVDAEGLPNVSPKEIFAVVDCEHLVIANIASPTSVRNIGSQPRVCVSFVDVFVQKGFKVSRTKP